MIVGVAEAHSVLRAHRTTRCRAWGLDLYTGDFRESENAADEPGSATPFLPDPEEEVLAAKIVMVRVRTDAGARVFEAKIGKGDWMRAPATLSGASPVRPWALSGGSWVVTLVKIETE